MADNVAITPGSGATAAADNINDVLYQRIKITHGTDGVADGDASAATPLPVRLDQGPNAVLENQGAIQVESLANEFSKHTQDTGIPSYGDEPVQMVGLHPDFPLPIDTATPIPVAGIDANGVQRQLQLGPNNGLVLNDAGESGTFRFGNQVARPSKTWDTVGYQSISIYMNFPAPSSGCDWQFSNDLVNWFPGPGWSVSGATGTPIIWRSSFWGETNACLMLIPTWGRYFRIVPTSNGGVNAVISIVLRSTPVPITTFQSSAQGGTGSVFAGVNLAHINNTAISAASAQLGVAAFGPTAAGAAHGTNNPLQVSGSDGTNARRILTDTSGNTQVVGPAALAGSLIPATSRLGPVMMGAEDLENRVRRISVDVAGRPRVVTDESGSRDDGIVDALNNVVRELKLLNAKITDLPFYLGINAVMPDDDKAFRDDPTIFNA